MTVGAGGVSSYGISALFDNGELRLSGTPATSELLPAGLTNNLTAGVFSESNLPGGTVHTFEAVTLGTGPANANFLIGTITFRVQSATDDGAPDLTPGFFNSGVDGCFDNTGNAVAPTFNAGFLTPAPPSLRVVRTATNTVAISWPTLSNGFGLQQNTNRVNSVNWSNVIIVPTDDGTTLTVIVSPPTGKRFYRLFKP